MLPPIFLRTLPVLIVSALVAGASLAADPVVGPQQRIDTNGGTFSASETTCATGDSNPDEIVAAWNDWRDSPTVSNEVIRMGVALSQDGGETWDDFLIRPPAPFQSGAEGDPMATFDERTGALWVGAISFAGNGGLFVARKNAGDAFFQPSVMADIGAGVDKCWMEAGRSPFSPDSTRVYIAYNFGVVSSDDLGDSWTNPVPLESGIGFLPRIGPEGELYVAYWNFVTEDFRIARSLNGGGTFVARQVADRMDTWGAETFNSRFPGTFRVAPLLGLAVDPNDGTLYGVWPDTTDQNGGQANVDVYFSKSSDRGDSWTTPVILNGEGPHVGDQFFPWIEVDATGRLHVVFLDSRNRDQADNVTNGFFDAYYAYSEDGGDSWTEIRLTPDSWNSDDDGLNRTAQFVGDYLGMAVADETVWPIYPDTSSGDPDTYTNRISFEECLLPAAVTGLALSRTPTGAIKANWANLPQIFNYTVFQDTDPRGTFASAAGQSLSGFLGAVFPLPVDDRYYLVAGRNSCGLGPKRSEPALP